MEQPVTATGAVPSRLRPRAHHVGLQRTAGFPVVSRIPALVARRRTLEWWSWALLNCALQRRICAGSALLRNEAPMLPPHSALAVSPHVVADGRHRVHSHPGGARLALQFPIPAAPTKFGIAGTFGHARAGRPRTRRIRKHGASAVFELQVRRIEVAEVERLADGRWLSRVGLLWSEQLQHEAVAGTPHQARRWVQAWLRAQMPRINRARPVMPGLGDRAKPWRA